MQLDAIGLASGTDKSSRDHDFLTFYEEFFEPRRKSVFTLLEIGVYHGESLKTWGEYFSNAICVGIDINPEAGSYVSLDNTYVRIGDASRPEVMDSVISEFGAPSIVIDDGSHLWHDQIDTLHHMWPLLASGGYFIIEDIHTSFPALADAYRGVSKESAYDYILRLQRWVVGNRQMGTEQPSAGFIEDCWRSVRSIYWYRGTCMLCKR